MEQQYRDQILSRWTGGFTVLAFLFAHPDSSAMRSLDSRGDYFDIRSGNTWDLFFPGYYKSDRDDYFESQFGALRAGQQFTRDWYFNPREFDDLRQHVEEKCQGQWRYSGEADLVLTNAYMPDQGELTIDWASTVSGPLSDPALGILTMTLATVIENLSRDLELNNEDEVFGVRAVVNPPGEDDDRTRPGREFFVSVLAEIAAALAVKPFGLS